ncbi:VacJ family lipoprotein [Methylobacter sp. G7]|uniref:MlaA family lipoprotein n=1 Tax=Methylobacter sp. G7 TaxID=3230117 RepID=UPI003D805ACD
MSMKKIINTRLLVISLIISSLMDGCAGLPKVNEDDPWEAWNREAQGFNNDFDNTIVMPLTKGYTSITPEFFNDATANFFSNFNDIGVTVNDLLQLKMAQGGLDASRFLINTTAGVGGLIDVATMLDLPKHNEDFGQTLGFWGVPSGNYLVVPFLGASSPRGLIGVIGDALMNPLTYSFVFTGSGTLFKAISAANSPRQVVGVLGTAAATAVMDPLTYPFAVFGNGRVVSSAVSAESGLVVSNETEFTSPENAVTEDPIDRYDYIKSVYQQQRKYLVHDGMVTDEDQRQLADDDTESMNAEPIGVNYGRLRKRYQHMFISP